MKFVTNFRANGHRPCTRTVLIRRRRQRRYNSDVYYISQPHQPCISRHHLWRRHFLHFTNSIYSTLHAMIDDVMYPLVFGLLPGKSKEIYDRYFNLLKTTCQQHQLQLTPQTFFTTSRQLLIIPHNEHSHKPL